MTDTLAATTTEQAPAAPMTPDHILQVGMGFFASRTLLSAVEMKLFTIIGNDGLTSAQIGSQLQLSDRSRDDFLDALIIDASKKFLHPQLLGTDPGDGRDGSTEHVVATPELLCPLDHRDVLDTLDNTHEFRVPSEV